MSREAHVRFWESAGVQLPRATHLVVLNETHLRRLLREYLIYYHGARTHLSLAKDAPEPRPVERPDEGRIVETPMVGGLHHRYGRRAA
jgi:putative transposase